MDVVLVQVEHVGTILGEIAGNKKDIGSVQLEMLTVKQPYIMRNINHQGRAEVALEPYIVSSSGCVHFSVNKILSCVSMDDIPKQLKDAYIQAATGIVPATPNIFSKLNIPMPQGRKN